MGSVKWGQEIADAYDVTQVAMFDSSVLDPMVALLVELSAGGRALEFAVGTGRVAIPLGERGVPVHGIELSPHMADQLRRKPGANRVGLTLGGITHARVEGSFRLVYLVFNTIMNVTTQEEQVAVFENAAAHLEPGGVFVVEVVVPQFAEFPPTSIGRVFAREDDHLGVETFDDVASQLAWSHHWMQVDGRLIRHSAPYRYVWPSELDLMARIAGLERRDRWCGWRREPFTSTSIEQVVVYEKPH